MSDDVSRSVAALPVNIFEYEPLARARMERTAWDYFASGAEDERTLRENRDAFARIRLRPRALVDVSRVDMATTVLGTPISMPIMVPPMAYQRLACRRRRAGDGARQRARPGR